MKRRVFLPIQTVAIFLVACLVWTSGTAEAIQDTLHPAPRTLQQQLTPPASLGQVIEYFNAENRRNGEPANLPDRPIAASPSRPLVILVQDLHAHYGAQKNIAGLLEFLAKKLEPANRRPGDLANIAVSPPRPLAPSPRLPFALAVEGASGPIDSSVMALFPDPKIKQEAADYLMREGELTGAEYFAVMRGLPDALHGVEDLRLYTLHRDLFRKTLEDRQETVQALRKIQADLIPLRKKLYSDPVKAIQAKIDAFEQARLGLADFAGYLASLVGGYGVPLEAGYPRLAAYLHDPSRVQLTDLDAVYQEAHQLAFRLKASSAKEKAEKDLVYVEQDLALLLRVADLQATEREVRDFGPRINEFVALADALLETANRRDGESAKSDVVAGAPVRSLALRHLISSSLDYYVMAFTRNKPMVENTLALLGQSSGLRVTSSESKPETRNSKPETAVLVAGGFHTAPITQLLRERGISYLVLTPSIDKITEADHDLYVRRLSGERLTHEEIVSAATRPTTRLARLWPFHRSNDSLAIGIYGVMLTNDILDFAAGTLRIYQPAQLRQWLRKKSEEHPEIFSRAKARYEKVFGPISDTLAWPGRSSAELLLAIDPTGSLAKKVTLQADHIDVGGGILRYREATQRTGSYLPTKALSLGDLPYPSGLREPEPFGEIPPSFEAIPTVNVTLPTDDVFLVSESDSGSGGLVRLGFLADNRPVAVITAYPDHPLSDAELQNQLLRDYRGALINGWLGIGPKPHGKFRDQDYRWNFVVDVLPGDMPEAMTDRLTHKTVEDLREIKRRLQSHGMRIAGDFQYYVTRKGGIQLVDSAISYDEFTHARSDWQDTYVAHLTSLLKRLPADEQARALRDLQHEESATFETVQRELESNIQAIQHQLATQKIVDPVAAKRAIELSESNLANAQSLQQTIESILAERGPAPGTTPSASSLDARSARVEKLLAHMDTAVFELTRLRRQDPDAFKHLRQDITRARDAEYEKIEKALESGFLSSQTAEKFKQLEVLGKIADRVSGKGVLTHPSTYIFGLIRYQQGWTNYVRARLYELLNMRNALEAIIERLDWDQYEVYRVRIQEEFSPSFEQKHFWFLKWAVPFVASHGQEDPILDTQYSGMEEIVTATQTGFRRGAVVGLTLFILTSAPSLETDLSHIAARWALSFLISAIAGYLTGRRAGIRAHRDYNERHRDDGAVLTPARPLPDMPNDSFYKGALQIWNGLSPQNRLHLRTKINKIYNTNETAAKFAEIMYSYFAGRPVPAIKINDVLEQLPKDAHAQLVHRFNENYPKFAVKLPEAPARPPAPAIITQRDQLIKHLKRLGFLKVQSKLPNDDYDQANTQVDRLGRSMGISKEDIQRLKETAAEVMRSQHRPPDFDAGTILRKAVDDALRQKADVKSPTAPAKPKKPSKNPEQGSLIMPLVLVLPVLGISLALAYLGLHHHGLLEFFFGGAVAGKTVLAGGGIYTAARVVRWESNTSLADERPSQARELADSIWDGLAPMPRMTLLRILRLAYPNSTRAFPDHFADVIEWLLSQDPQKKLPAGASRSLITDVQNNLPEDAQKLLRAFETAQPGQLARWEFTPLEARKLDRFIHRTFSAPVQDRLQAIQQKVADYSLEQRVQRAMTLSTNPETGDYALRDRAALFDVLINKCFWLLDSNEKIEKGLNPDADDPYSRQMEIWEIFARLRSEYPLRSDDASLYDWLQRIAPQSKSSTAPAAPTKLNNLPPVVQFAPVALGGLGMVGASLLNAPAGVVALIAALTVGTTLWLFWPRIRELWSPQTAPPVGRVTEAGPHFKIADTDTLPPAISEKAAIKARRVDLSHLPVGTIVHYEIANGNWFYTIRIEPEGKVTIWLRQDLGCINGSSNQIGTRDKASDYETLGQLEEGRKAYMPYFHQTPFGEGPRRLVQIGLEGFDAAPENIRVELPIGTDVSPEVLEPTKSEIIAQRADADRDEELISTAMMLFIKHLENKTTRANQRIMQHLIIELKELGKSAGLSDMQIDGLIKLIVNQAQGSSNIEHPVPMFREKVTQWLNNNRSSVPASPTPASRTHTRQDQRVFAANTQGPHSSEQSRASLETFPKVLLNWSDPKIAVSQMLNISIKRRIKEAEKAVENGNKDSAKAVRDAFVQIQKDLSLNPQMIPSEQVLPVEQRMASGRQMVDLLAQESDLTPEGSISNSIIIITAAHLAALINQHSFREGNVSPLESSRVPDPTPQTHGIDLLRQGNVLPEIIPKARQWDTDRSDQEITDFEQELAKMPELHRLLTDSAEIRAIRGEVHRILDGTYDSISTIFGAIDIALAARGYTSDYLTLYFKGNGALLHDLFYQFVPDDVPLYRVIEPEYAGRVGSRAFGDVSHWVIGEAGRSGAEGYRYKSPDKALIRSTFGDIRRFGVITTDRVSNISGAVKLVLADRESIVPFNLVDSTAEQDGQQPAPPLGGGRVPASFAYWTALAMGRGRATAIRWGQSRLVGYKAERLVLGAVGVLAGLFMPILGVIPLAFAAAHWVPMSIVLIRQLRAPPGEHVADVSLSAVLKQFAVLAAYSLPALISPLATSIAQPLLFAAISGLAARTHTRYDKSIFSSPTSAQNTNRFVAQEGQTEQPGADLAGREKVNRFALTPEDAKQLADLVLPIIDDSMNKHVQEGTLLSVLIRIHMALKPYSALDLKSRPLLDRLVNAEWRAEDLGKPSRKRYLDSLINLHKNIQQLQSAQNTNRFVSQEGQTEQPGADLTSKRGDANRFASPPSPPTPAIHSPRLESTPYALRSPALILTHATEPLINDALLHAMRQRITLRADTDQQRREGVEYLDAMFQEKSGRPLSPYEQDLFNFYVNGRGREIPITFHPIHPKQNEGGMGSWTPDNPRVFFAYPFQSAFDSDPRSAWQIMKHEMSHTYDGLRQSWGENQEELARYMDPNEQRAQFRLGQQRAHQEFRANMWAFDGDVQAAYSATLRTYHEIQNLVNDTLGDPQTLNPEQVYRLIWLLNQEVNRRLYVPSVPEDVEVIKAAWQRVQTANEVATPPAPKGKAGAFLLEYVTKTVLKDAALLDAGIASKLADFVTHLVAHAPGRAANDDAQMQVDQILSGTLPLNQTLALLGLKAQGPPETWTEGDQSATVQFVSAPTDGPSLWDRLLSKQDHPTPFGLILQTPQGKVVLIPRVAWQRLIPKQQAFIRQHEVWEVNDADSSHARTVQRQGLTLYNQTVAGLKGTLSSPIAYYQATRVYNGHMTEVFKGTDPLTGHPVILKVANSLAENPQVENEIAILKRIAESSGRVDTAYFPRLLNQGDFRGRTFLVTDYFEGETLRDENDHLNKKDPQQANLTRHYTELFVEILKAIRQIHAIGITHVDLTPRNILVRHEGSRWVVRIIDFGSAYDPKLGLIAASHSTTPGYGAPELHIKGAIPNPRNDIFSLGVVLYAMFVDDPGLKPWQTIPYSRRLDPGIQSILQKATAEDPEQRYPSIAAFAYDLHSILAKNNAAVASPDISNRDIVQITVPEFGEADFSRAQNQVLEAVKANKIVALSLAEWKDKPTLYEMARYALTTIGGLISPDYSKRMGRDSAFELAELLKNAFTHGNQLDRRLPIYIYIDNTAPSIHVIDTANPRKADASEWEKARREKLTGASHGLESLKKAWDYNAAPIEIDGVKGWDVRITPKASEAEEPSALVRYLQQPLANRHSIADDSELAHEIAAQSTYLLRYAARFSKSAVDREDLVQQTWYRVVHADTQFRGDADIRTYLVKTLRNVSINETRSRSRRKYQAHIPFPEGFDPPDASIPADAAILNQQSHAAVKTSIESMPAKAQAVLMRRADGESYRDISEAEEIPVGTVKSMLSRARKGITNALQAFSAGEAPVNSPLTAESTRFVGIQAAAARRAQLQRAFGDKPDHPGKATRLGWTTPWKPVDLDSAMSKQEREYRYLLASETLEVFKRDVAFRLTPDEGEQLWIQEFYAPRAEADHFSTEDRAMQFADQHARPGEPIRVTVARRADARSIAKAKLDATRAASDQGLSELRAQRQAIIANARAHQAHNKSNRFNPSAQLTADSSSDVALVYIEPQRHPDDTARFYRVPRELADHYLQAGQLESVDVGWGEPQLIVKPGDERVKTLEDLAAQAAELTRIEILLKSVHEVNQSKTNQVKRMAGLIVLIAAILSGGAVSAQGRAHRPDVRASASLAEQQRDYASYKRFQTRGEAYPTAREIPPQYQDYLNSLPPQIERGLRILYHINPSRFTRLADSRTPIKLATMDSDHGGSAHTGWIEIPDASTDPDLKTPEDRDVATAEWIAHELAHLDQLPEKGLHEYIDTWEFVLQSRKGIVKEEKRGFEEEDYVAHAWNQERHTRFVENMAERLERGDMRSPHVRLLLNAYENRFVAMRAYWFLLHGLAAFALGVFGHLGFKRAKALLTASAGRGGMHAMADEDIDPDTADAMAETADQRPDVQTLNVTDRRSMVRELRNHSAPQTQIGDILNQNRMSGLRTYWDQALNTLDSARMTLTAYADVHELIVKQTAPGAPEFETPDRSRSLEAFGMRRITRGKRSQIVAYAQDRGGILHEVAEHALAPGERGSMPTEARRKRAHTIGFFMEGLADGQVLTVRLGAISYVVAVPNRALRELDSMSLIERQLFIDDFDRKKSQAAVKFPSDADGLYTYDIVMITALNSYAQLVQAARKNSPKPGSPLTPINNPARFSPTAAGFALRVTNAPLSGMNPALNIVGLGIALNQAQDVLSGPVHEFVTQRARDAAHVRQEIARVTSARAATAAVAGSAPHIDDPALTFAPDSPEGRAIEQARQELTPEQHAVFTAA
jgi:RNA polymerase sigma factor (sigma-70 family)